MLSIINKLAIIIDTLRVKSTPYNGIFIIMALLNAAIMGFY